jgi:hypothetical protein
LGRRGECEFVEQLLAQARAGRSGVLVMRGEAGIGKTALLPVRTRGRVGVPGGVRGVESEMEFAFGGLHQLCAPRLDHLGALPDPQRAAVGVAFGLRTGAPPDRFPIPAASSGRDQGRPGSLGRSTSGPHSIHIPSNAGPVVELTMVPGSRAAGPSRPEEGKA